MAELSAAEVYQLAVKAGWSTTPESSLTIQGHELSPAEVISAIASAESNRTTNALNPGGNGDSEVSVGLLQLNANGGLGSPSELSNLGLPNYSVQQLTNPLTNLQVALADYNKSVAAGSSPLEAFQGPWEAELGAPGSSPETGANYNAFLTGLLPYLTQNIPDTGSDQSLETEATNLTSGGTSYTFSQIEALLKERGSPIGSGNGPSSTVVGGSGPGGGSTGTTTNTPASSSTTATASGFVSDIMRDVEIAALVLGAAAGLFLAVSHLASGGVSIPGIEAKVTVASGTPEIWWLIGSASVVVLWSVFTKQNPFCVFTHLTSSSPGSCKGTLSGGTVIETLLALWGASKLFPSLTRLFPGTNTTTSGNDNDTSGEDGSEGTSNEGTGDEGTGGEGTSGEGAGDEGLGAGDAAAGE